MPETGKRKRMQILDIFTSNSEFSSFLADYKITKAENLVDRKIFIRGHKNMLKAPILISKGIPQKQSSVVLSDLIQLLIAYKL